MRKCVAFGVSALFALMFLLPTQISAQGVFVGAGGTVPTGDYGEYADMGWMLEAGVNYPINESGLYVFGEGMFGSNGHGGDHGIDGDKTNLLGLFGGVELNLAPDEDAGIFIFAQVGMLKHSYKSEEFSEYEDSESALAFGGGAGYAFPIGGMNGWVLGRYLQGQFDGEDGNTAFFGVFAGVSFPFGG